MREEVLLVEIDIVDLSLATPFQVDIAPPSITTNPIKM